MIGRGAANWSQASSHTTTRITNSPGPFFSRPRNTRTNMNTAIWRSTTIRAVIKIKTRE